MAKVQVQVTGGALTQQEAATVGELKQKLSVPNHQAVVNGDAAGDDFQLEDFQFVALAPSVKGA